MIICFWEGILDKDISFGRYIHLFLILSEAKYLVLDDNSTVNHNTIRGTANGSKENEKNESQENQLHCLKLMGFQQESIRIIQSEYPIAIIEEALNHLKLADNIAHPKEQFLAEISKLNKA